MAKLIKDRIKELEKHNRLFAENLAEVLLVIDVKTLKYEYVTPSIFKISGYTSKEILNKKVTDDLKPESSKRLLELLNKSLTEYDGGEHSARSLELEFTHKKGGTYWVEIKGKLAKDPDSPLKIVSIAKDITERKKAEQQLEQKNKELAEALAEKERLLKEIKVLHELLPICSGCKRIRDDDGKWWPLDTYIASHTDSDFTHTICPDCKDVFYPESKK